MILSLLSAALLSSAGPTTMAMADTNADKKICKREKQIGSLVRAKKTCRTKSEWDEIAKQSRDEVDRIQRSKSFPGE